MDLILDRGYTLSVALDGGSLVATYPYDKPVQSGSFLHSLQIDLTASLYVAAIC